jgi:hypothetical protein
VFQPCMTYVSGRLTLFLSALRSRVDGVKILVEETEAEKARLMIVNRQMEERAASVGISTEKHPETNVRLLLLTFSLLVAYLKFTPH